MIPVERQRAILRALRTSGSASINELADSLDVSHMTIRRDVRALEAAGRVMSVSGGVTLPARLAADASHLEKAGLHPAQKAAIARAAVGSVSAGDLVYLDAGTTTLAIATELAARSDLVFVTNDLAIATYLSERTPSELYVAAGRVDRANLSTEGEMVAAVIAEFNIDVAFMSTSSFDLRGISVPNGAKKVVKQAIVAASTTTVLVTDSSKYGRVAALRAVPLPELDSIVTDTGLPESVRHSLGDLDVTLHLVEADS